MSNERFRTLLLACAVPACVAAGCSVSAPQAAAGVPPLLAAKPLAVRDIMSTSRMRVATRRGEETTSFAKPQKKGTPLIYLSDGEKGAVFGFTPTGENVLRIGGLKGPWGLFVDSKRNLWVADNEGDRILAFRKGETKPVRTLHYPGMAPDDVTVCPNGTVYVTSTSAAGQTGIAVYAGGSNTPTGSLNDPEVWGYNNIMCDAANNVFVNLEIATSWLYYPSLEGVVDEFAQGTQSGLTRLPIANTGIGLRPFGENLLVSFGRTVAEYKETGVATGYQIQVGSYSTGIAVSGSDKLVLVAEAGARLGISWRFPSGEPDFIYRAKGMPYPLGAAYDPGEQF